MRRIPLALALVGAVAVTGCMGGGKTAAPSTDSGAQKGVTGQYYFVNFNPPVGGTIVSDIGGINCGASAVSVFNNGPVATPDYQYTYTYIPGATACGTAGQTQFQWAETVVLTATPATGNSFYGWAGDCSGTGKCTFTAGADKTVVAIFGPPGGGHGNFMNPADHVPAYSQGVLDCAKCHGPTLAGQGIAPSCASCHAMPAWPPGSVSFGPEYCATCHGTSGSQPVATVHALKNQVAVSNIAIDGTGADIVITYNVKVDGVNRDDFTTLAGVYSWVYSSTSGSAVRTTLTLTGTPVVSSGNGNYTLTAAGFGATGTTPAVFETTSFMIRTQAGTVAQPQAAFLAHYTTGNIMPGVLVSNQACLNCHGDFVFAAQTAGVPNGHHGANPYGVEACVVCHDRDSSMETRLGAPGTRLMGYVHGIHSSHNMPGAVDTAGAAVPAGIYYRNGGATSTFSIGFPSYMNNCSTCHDSGDLAVISATPVSWKACMSCHIGPPVLAGTQTVAAGFAWAGFGVANTGTATAPVFSFNGQNHAGFAAATTCTTAGCHDGTVAPGTIAGFHNGLKTERSGLLWNGADQSLEIGKTIAMSITGVTPIAGTPGELSITWTAAQGATTLDPCNTDITAGPVFFGTANAATGMANGNMSFLRSYAQGNDWVGSAAGTAPGQPVSTNLALGGTASGRTTCASNVATTVISLAAANEAGTATRGVVSLQGKPQVRYTPTIGTNLEVIQVRAPSPVREFVPATGGAPSVTRRQIVSNEKCLACHKGSLYQHGGNRIDSVDLCVTCHNPASNDKNWRDSYGVTAANSYDGKTGETYDLRTMVHAIHSSGETSMPWVIYRGSNGVYAFGSQAALDALPNWPTVSPALVYPGLNATTRNHTKIVVHYPRPLNDCNACHINGSQNGFGDQAERMAVTMAADGVVVSGVTGTGSGAAFANQTDDVLRGAGAQSCTTCHQYGATFPGGPALQAATQSHVNTYGFAPQAFPGGRSDLINFATCGFVTCP